MATVLPLQLPEHAWQKPHMQAALRDRDMSTLFKLVQQYTGASQARIGTAVDMNQGRVNEVISRRRVITTLTVFERVAEGLAMPDTARHALGLAPAREAYSATAFDLAAFPEVVRVYSDQNSAAADIRHDAATARELDILAVRGLGLIGLNNSLLRSACNARDGHKPRVRVMLLDPDSPAIGRRATEIGESSESLGGGVRLTEARLRELERDCDLQVFRYRTVPTWRLIRVDSTVYVSAFDAEWEGHESATYKVMETPYGPLYRGFHRMFDAMLDEATPVRKETSS